jgi:hypothetical protein
MHTDPKLRSQVDALRDKFWTGGLANPLDVIEQVSYLLFINLNLVLIMLYSNNRIEELFHYRRVNELFLIVQATYIALHKKKNAPAAQPKLNILWRNYVAKN